MGLHLLMLNWSYNMNKFISQCGINSWTRSKLARIHQILVPSSVGVDGYRRNDWRCSLLMRHHRCGRNKSDGMIGYTNQRWQTHYPTSIVLRLAWLFRCSNNFVVLAMSGSYLWSSLNCISSCIHSGCTSIRHFSSRATTRWAHWMRAWRCNLLHL